MILRISQLLLEFRNTSVLQFRHPGEVSGTTGRFYLAACLVQGFLDVLTALNRCLFRLPDLIEIGVLSLDLRDLSF